MATSFAAVLMVAFAGTGDPLVVERNYDASKSPGAPDYAETLVQLYYPDGSGPTAVSGAVDPRPVVISLRGGNTNSVVPGVVAGEPPFLIDKALEKGWVAAWPNYPVAGPGEDYETPVAGVGLLVQYLRAYHAVLNIRPDRVFCLGRSGGGIVAYAVALKEDLREPSSADPTLHWSSRPDACIALSSPTNLSCFHPLANGFIDDYFIPGQPFSAGSFAAKQAASSDYWLSNPDLYGRESTPPLCLVYYLDPQGACGFIIDPHDGHFGQVMKDALAQYVVASGDAALGASSATIDGTGLLGPVIQDLAVDWIDATLANDPYPGLHLAPPLAPLGQSGWTATMRASGAQSGDPVWFFAGAAQAPQSTPVCPGLGFDLFGFVSLGAAVASVDGLATLALPVPPGLAGISVYLQAADFIGCAASEVEYYTVQ